MSDKIHLFAVTHNSDLTEGRGHTVTLAHFEDKNEALKVVNDPRYKKWCVMGVHQPGREQHNVSERTIVVYHSAEEFWEQYDTDAKRARALAKLTPEDRKLLGLA